MLALAQHAGVRVACPELEPVLQLSLPGPRSQELVPLAALRGRHPPAQQPVIYGSEPLIRAGWVDAVYQTTWSHRA